MPIDQDFETSEDVIFPPGDLESNEPPLETTLHLQQMLLLIKVLEWWWRNHLRVNDFFAAGNITIYFSQRQSKLEDFRGPDFFVVRNTENRLCTTNKYGFPVRHRTRCKTFFGFQTGDMVRAILPTGKFAGTHVARLTVRESGVFEMKTLMGKVSPVRHKYCKSIHRNDGYMYAFSTNVQ